MTSLTITNLDDKTTNQIIRMATRHGRSMEDEARVLLQQALEVIANQLSQESPAVPEGDRRENARHQPQPSAGSDPDTPPRGNLASRIRARFEPIGGVELDLPPREPGREPPSFD
ncbi:plasmid stabilization protein [Jiella endophytica]|uniref:Plasmid stabilization protein n=1 Tax=Jiella endophytica TaxID=2558362 RepID=A0A4Y8RMZ7_9HYPH|nr:plasmid stabilization protein [Jiella endophytica]TFF24939.1 plasmid stabilization protein [Jiella endophytica]